MKKQAIIDYLNIIRPYVNLTSLCKAYNQKYKKNAIDYNNLRYVLNGGNKTRLSEEKMAAFYSFLKKDIFEDIFTMHFNELRVSSVERIINSKIEEMKKEIAEAMNYGVPTEQ